MNRGSEEGMNLFTIMCGKGHSGPSQSSRIALNCQDPAHVQSTQCQGLICGIWTFWGPAASICFVLGLHIYNLTIKTASPDPKSGLLIGLDSMLSVPKRCSRTLLLVLVLKNRWWKIAPRLFKTSILSKCFIKSPLQSRGKQEEEK